MTNENVINIERNESVLREQFYMDYHIMREYPLHRHDFYEIELVSSTGCINVINGVDVPVNGTVCFFYCPHIAHKYLSPEGHEIRVYNIAFSETFVSSACMSCLHTRDYIFTAVAPSEKHSIISDFHALYRDFNGHASTRRLLLRSRLETVIAGLGAEYDMSTEDDGNAAPPDADYSGMLRVLSYISRNFTRRISVADLAALAHVSPKYFSSYFKSTVGMPYIKYITKLRMNYALDLLTGSDHSLSRIAAEVGYNSESNFISAFRNYHGMHPAELRRARSPKKSEEKDPSQP